MSIHRVACLRSFACCIGKVSGRIENMNKPSSILFICGMNAIRSPMAEAIAKSILKKDVFVQSAGLQEGEHDHFVDAVLAEINLDLRHHQPRIYNEMADGFFDVLVALTPEAHKRALDITKTSAVDVIYWPTEDPTLVKGTRDQMLGAYRDVRESLTKRIRDEFLP